MTTPVNRHLTDDERSILLYLAAVSLATQTGADLDTAYEALGTFVDEGRLILHGDALMAYVSVTGTRKGRRTLVDISREDLAIAMAAKETGAKLPPLDMVRRVSDD